MEKPPIKSSKDEPLLFAREDESQRALPPSDQPKFKLLIVDDEKEIHVMTKLVKLA